MPSKGFCRRNLLVQNVFGGAVAGGRIRAVAALFGKPSQYSCSAEHDGESVMKTGTHGVSIPNHDSYQGSSQHAIKNE